MGRLIKRMGFTVQSAALVLAWSSAPAAAAAVSSMGVAGSKDVGAVAVGARAPQDRFDVLSDLQGIYDELSQADPPAATESDAEAYHAVMYAPDWVFVDASGQRQTWPQVREREPRALSAGPLDSRVQTIQQLSLDPKGATAVVTLTTVRTVVDAEGRYGRPGASHTLTETTTFRDRWVRVSDEWKFKSREQVGRAAVSVDKPEY
jgi:hypothetical protein